MKNKGAMPCIKASVSNSSLDEIKANLTIQTVDENLLTPVLGEILKFRVSEKPFNAFWGRILHSWKILSGASRLITW
jgi:hypothetical protein